MMKLLGPNKIKAISFFLRTKRTLLRIQHSWLYVMFMCLLAICILSFVPLMFSTYDLDAIVIKDNVLHHMPTDAQPRSKFSKPPLIAHVKKRKFFAPFLTNNKKRQHILFLCKLGYNNWCRTSDVAEVIDALWVIAPIYSAHRDETKVLFQLHNDFKSYIRSFGISFCTLEAIRKDLNQEYVMTIPGNEPYDIQSQIYDEAYLRENLLNVALKKIPDWEYAGWIDAHQYFENNYWWEESIVKIEKYAIIQPIKGSMRLSLKNESRWYRDSIIMMSTVQKDLDVDRDSLLPEYGNAYLMRREIYEKIEYILDTCIASGCDLSLVSASIGKENFFGYFKEIVPKLSAQYDPWIAKARQVINGSRSFIRGEIFHFDHEHYMDYCLVPLAFEKAGFNINEHLERDENGTLRITNSTIRDIIPNMHLVFERRT